MNKQRVFGFLASLVLAAFCLSPFSGSVFAQTDEPTPSIKNRGALYYLGEQDELLIKVNIWGFVTKPGQYMVPKETDLISLLSFAGGPREEAKLKKIRVIRNHALLAAGNPKTGGYLAMNGNSALDSGVTSTSAGKTGDIRTSEVETVLEVNVKKYMKTADQRLIPDLQPGDTIIVEGSTFHFIGKAFEFATKLAVIAQIYFWIYAAKK